MTLAGLNGTYKAPILENVKIDEVVGEIAYKINNTQSIADLWTSQKSFDSHVTKRAALGHITDTEDYKRKISHSLANSTQYSLALGGNIELMELRSKNWSVIFNGRGEIKTAYKIEPDMASFKSNHQRLGYQVYEDNISDRIRKELKRLFGSR